MSSMSFISRDATGVITGGTLSDHGPDVRRFISEALNAGMTVEYVPLTWALTNCGSAAKHAGSARLGDPMVFCRHCAWLGIYPASLGIGACPMCFRATGLMIIGPTAQDAVAAAVAPPPSILDAAIAGSTALDPAGNHRTAEQLRVPDQATRDAEQSRLADYFRKNGVL